MSPPPLREPSSGERRRTDGTPGARSDPGLLEIAGQLLNVLGAVEHLQRLLPLTRLAVAARHRRIERLRSRFVEALNDARAALRLLRAVVSQPAAEMPAGGENTGPPIIAFDIPASEMPVYRRALKQLQDATRKMTNAAYELEGVAKDLPNQAEAYHRISQGGRRVLDSLKETLAVGPAALGQLLDVVEPHLSRCAGEFAPGGRNEG